MQHNSGKLRFKSLVQGIVIVILHYWLASTSTALSFENGVTPIWPSAGLFLAAILLIGYRILPLIFLSDLAIGWLVIYQNPTSIIMNASADVSEALLAAILIHRFIGYTHIFESAKNVFRFILSILSVWWVGATIGVTALCNNRIKIAIADNGPGIPDAVKKRLFDPFFTTKPIGKGTGMGLSISYQIVTEKHQGKIFCHSTPGQGTEFEIKIPMQQQIA